MSIELKQAAQRALNALDEATTYTGSPSWSPSMTDECIAAASALRASLAQQPATPEPVGFVDFQGTVFWHDGPPTADSLLFAAKPVSHDKAKWCEYVAGMVFAWLEMQENLKEEDRCIKAIAGIIERRMWALLATRPAPSVPMTMTMRMIELLADITPEEHHDDNGPGSIDCPACGRRMKMKWRAGKRVDRTEELPHDENCPAEWARAMLAAK